MKKELQQQALEVVEMIVSGDNKRISQKQRDAIYRFSHCALFRCKNPHHDWVMELKKEYEAYKKVDLL